MNTQITQLEQVRKHLRSGKKLTTWQAIMLYNITRLSAHIHTLRSEGMPIVGKVVTKEGKHWTEYKCAK
jgi:hypothetical protein